MHCGRMEAPLDIVTLMKYAHRHMTTTITSCLVGRLGSDIANIIAAYALLKERVFEIIYDRGFKTEYVFQCAPRQGKEKWHCSLSSHPFSVIYLTFECGPISFERWFGDNDIFNMFILGSYDALSETLVEELHLKHDTHMKERWGLFERIRHLSMVVNTCINGLRNVLIAGTFSAPAVVAQS
jgi:hypothetical protein